MNKFFNLVLKLKWVGLFIVLVTTIYLLFPKYYFSDQGGVLKYRCNRITGHCDFRSATGPSDTKGNWENLNK